MIREKHMFAGNNSSCGFFSYFNCITNPIEAKHIYILKGGPGVGKSSIMKKFASEMHNKGYCVEQIHCSSDENSLDGVIIPEIKVAMFDGTPPHAIEPSLPGVTDEIINLGTYLNNKEIEKHKNQIIQINKAKSSLYKSAYRYIKSASLISEEINSIYDQFTDNLKFNTICTETIKKLFTTDFTANKIGSVRKFFACAVTSNGFVDYTQSLCKGCDVWHISGENINYTDKLLQTVLAECTRRGLDAECYFNPINVEKLEGIYIPEMNIILINTKNNVNSNHNYKENINLQDTMNSDKLKLHISDIENNMHLFDTIMENAYEKLSLIKKQHELLELFYVNSMDFAEVDKCYKKILAQYL